MIEPIRRGRVLGVIRGSSPRYATRRYPGRYNIFVLAWGVTREPPGGRLSAASSWCWGPGELATVTGPHPAGALRLVRSPRELRAGRTSVLLLWGSRSGGFLHA